MDQIADNEKTVHWSSGINVILGVWLVLAPFVLGLDAIPQVVWNDVVVGLAIAIFALLRAAKPSHFEPLSWINLIFGLWLIIAPFVLDYGILNAGSALWNDITVGIVVLVLAGWSAATTRGSKQV